MNFNDEMKKYAQDKIFFSIPLLQKKFKTDYLTAHKFVDELVERSEAVFDSGNTYKYVGFRPPRGIGHNREFCGIDPGLFVSALGKCIDRNECSISSLRRVSCTDLSTACSLLNAFVEMGYVSQAQGAKKREILISKRRFLMLYGDLVYKAQMEEEKPEEDGDDDDEDPFDEIAVERIHKIIDECVDEEQRKEVVKRLITVLKNIIAKKSQS